MEKREKRRIVYFAKLNISIIYIVFILATGLIGSFKSVLFAYDLTPTFHSTIGEYAPLDLYPIAVAVDVNNNVFIVDLFYKSIEHRTLSGNIINKFFIQDAWPRSITIDDNGDLYTVDSLNCNVNKYSQSGQLLLTIGYKSSEPGGFIFPHGIAIDQQQRIIVADATTQISMFDQQGTLVWNNKFSVPAEGRLYDPQSMSIGPNQHIYISDVSNDAIMEYDADGTYIQKIGTAYLKAPVGVGVASDGSILVQDRRQFLSDIGQPQIYKFSSNGVLLATWGNKGRAPGELWEAHEVYMAPDDTLWVAGYHGHNVVRYDLNGNLLLEWNDHNVTAGEFARPVGAATGSGNVYLVDNWNQVVQVYDRHGYFQYLWGERGQGDGQVFNFPQITSSDQNGNIYIGDDHWLRKFDGDGNFIARIGSINRPKGSVSEPSGALWIVEKDSNQIRKYDASYNFELMVTSNDIPGGLNKPWGICRSPSGMLYVTDTINHRVVRLDQNGNYDMAWGTSAQAYFSAPTACEVDSQGNVYIAQNWSRKIQVFTADGVFLNEWGTQGFGPGNFWEIYDLALDGDYFLYVPDPQGIVHKYAMMPNFQESGKPLYIAGQDLGYYIWSEDGRTWHVRWSADGSQNIFEGTVHSSAPYLGLINVDTESMDDSITYSAQRVDFLASEINGEDGIDLIVSDNGIITFDFKVNGISTSSIIKIGNNSEVPTSLPIPFNTTGIDFFDPSGRPSYVPAQDAGYFLWQDIDDGEWHLRWSGDSVTTFYYNGTISSTSLTAVQEYDFEGNDSMQIGSTVISFSAYAGAGEDGIDFFAPLGEQITFDLYIDDEYQTSLVHIGQADNNPVLIPFVLSSYVCLSDIDSDGDGTLNCDDTDDEGDRMTDAWEDLYAQCLNRLVDDALGDCDSDGLTNLEEYYKGADPTDSDSDNDGLPDNSDNCTIISNFSQDDADADSMGDLCDSCPADPIVEIGETPYAHLQSAYDAAVEGAVIQSQNATLHGDIYLDSNKTVSLKGGHNCDYSLVTGTTIIRGDLIINEGSVTIENLVLDDM